MGSEIAPDARLDSVMFKILPQDRYDVCVCSGDKEEKVGCGNIDQLVVHLPQMKDLCSKGTCANFKLQLPQNLGDATWFSKTTLTRFLHIIDSPDALKKAISINYELSQLEETRQFHLSLYCWVHDDKLPSEETDDASSSDVVSTPKAGDGILSPDDSKNELLRAMDLRITLLREELVSSFNLAAQATCSIKEMVDVKKFCEHFGAVNLRKLLRKLLELRQNSQAVDVLENKKPPFTSDPKNHHVNRTAGNAQISRPLYTVKPVVYSASPAKAAQIDWQSSSENEASCSSEEDRPTAERSRTIVRSATPRRSASPMRRVQIGRSGLHRATALAIKSLNYFPARERTLSSRDGAPNDCEVEESEQTNEQTEFNVTRMSVQDAINLFESKQRAQTSDMPKRRSLTVGSANTNKFVVRRWSVGMGGSSAECHSHNAPEHMDPVNNTNFVEEDTANNTADLKACNPAPVYSESVEASRGDEELGTSDKSIPSPNEANILVSQEEEAKEKLDQAEWSQQKEAELNQILMKVLENKVITHPSAQPDNGKNCNPCPQLRGGSYSCHKERRDQNFQNNAGKKAEKQVQFKAMQKVLDKTEAKMSSRIVSDGRKKQSLNKTQKVAQNVPQDSNSKKESPKPAAQRKASPKASPLPATRKSWPSTPSPRAAGASPAKTPTPVYSSGPTASRQKPKPTASVSHPSPKVERARRQQRDVKKTQVDAKNSLKSVEENKRHGTSKSVKMAKPKHLTTSEGNAAVVPVKPGLRSKMAQKSSVVPMESKPPVCKASGISPSNSPSVMKTKVTLQAEEPMSKFADHASVQEDEVVASVPEPVSQELDGVPIAQEISIADLKQVDMRADTGKEESSSEVCARGGETILRIATSVLDIYPQEESIISPSSWVKRDQHDLPIPSCNSASQLASPANPAAMVTSGTRVRHSLSQMLIVESSEPDINEWGIAEIPPSMAYQKDAPKGLKRLLKFARKSRGEANVAGWSSPCTSEGEDDGDECKSLMRRSSDNLLRQAALNTKKYGQQASSTQAFERHVSDSGPPSAQSNASSSSALSSRKFQEGHSAAAITKAPRSFFSLSAFRGNKTTDTRLR